MLQSSQPEHTAAMAPDEQQFLKALGARIAQLRKEQGMSQQAMAEALGVAQQTIAHYEGGRIRMQISLLPEVAQLFGVTTDELLGRKSAAGKRGPASKMQQQVERLSRLPQAKQRVVMEMLEGFLSQTARSG
jgi:transcriptional regulator with XRE-family HTH domain